MYENSIKFLNYPNYYCRKGTKSRIWKINGRIRKWNKNFSLFLGNVDFEQTSRGSTHLRYNSIIKNLLYQNCSRIIGKIYKKVSFRKTEQSIVFPIMIKKPAKIFFFINNVFYIKSILKYFIRNPDLNQIPYSIRIFSRFLIKDFYKF